MHPPSRLTIQADSQSIAYLAARAQHRRQIAGSLTFACTNGTPNKTILKLAAEGTADVIINAQLPFFVTPESLTAGLLKLGIEASAVAEVVGQIASATSVKPAHEQVNDEQAAALLVSYLVASPYINGLRSVRPTAQAEPVPEPTADTTSQPARENPVTDDDWPQPALHDLAENLS